MKYCGKLRLRVSKHDKLLKLWLRFCNPTLVTALLSILMTFVDFGLSEREAEILRKKSFMKLIQPNMVKNMMCKKVITMER